MATINDLTNLIEIIVEASRRIFSATKTFVVLKFAAFGVAVAGIISGLHVQGSAGNQHGAGWVTFEIKLSESNTVQVVVVAALFAFVLVANLSCLNKSRELEFRLRELEMKAPPRLRRKLRASTKKRNV